MSPAVTPTLGAAASDALAEARQVLAAARIAVQNPDAGLDDAWPRAAALLARQALELAVEALLVDRIPEVDGVSMRVQMACLGELVGPGDAHEAAWLWARLSTACHHHPYDLAPTGDELSEWIDRVGAFVEATARRRRGEAGQG